MVVDANLLRANIEIPKDQVEMLRIPPSNHLEKLSGNLAKYWSLRINMQWRIIFKWEGCNAHDVKIVDYH